ncbi:glycoside hydrolase family 31 protein [candidate division KSB1 bacterium]|nr:glycoside hydrolase family 31 protein [candidate division KSB1 bacterium]
MIKTAGCATGPLFFYYYIISTDGVSDVKKVVLYFTGTLVFLKPEYRGLIWENGAYQISLDHNVLELSNGSENPIRVLAFEFNFIKPDTILLESVNSHSILLKLVFDETDGFHKDFPPELLLTISHSNHAFRFCAAHETFQHVTIQLEDQNEQYFGLIEKLYPGNRKDLNLRGQTVDVDVYGLGNQDYAENYASAYSAFYMSSAGYASFFDTFAKGRYQFAVDGITEIHHQTDTLDWYLFFGETGDQIHKEYFNVIGKPKKLPIWACGPIFWRDQNNGGANEILNDIREFTNLKIPLTACWVDRPYCDGGHEWSKMNFNEKFANPEAWIKEINETYGLEFMTWVGPMTFADPEFPGLLSGRLNYMDLTHPDALQEFEDRLKMHQYSVGVKGHKMDRADEHFPLTSNWFDPVSQTEARNKYVYLYSKVIHEFLTRAHGEDQFSFARAAFHRTQPFLSAIWGGDSRSHWKGMQGNQANAMRCGFMGFPVWGSDTGGYLGEGQIDETLYIRWLQWSAWSGLFEIKIDGAGGSGEDRAPWHCSPQLQKVFKRACELRMDFLPYIYSSANTSYKNGVLMKPLAYSYPGDENTHHIWDEFLFGNAFLIAPVFSDTDERDIYLPEGKWIDFYKSEKTITGPMQITRQVSLEYIPVFIKTNSIFVTGDIFQGNSRVWYKEHDPILVIHLIPGEDGDQTTFDYVDYFDKDLEKPMTLIRNKNRIVFKSEKLMSDTRIEIRYNAKPEKILLDNAVILFNYDQDNQIAIVDLCKNKEINLEIVTP